MANLGPQQINRSYLGLLQVEGGVTTTLQPVTDGTGVTTPWLLSTTSVGFTTLSMAGAINMNGYPINGLATPILATDAATKAYVDAYATGLQPKAAVVAATLSNITLSGAQTIDGVSVVAGDRVLVKNQAIQSSNGIYVVSASAWTRSSDADTWAELVGAYVFISQGSQSASSWVCNVAPGGTLGVTAVVFVKFSDATSTLANYLTFSGTGNGDAGVSDIATELGENIITEASDFLIIQTPATLQFNGSAPLTISYNSIGAIALDGSNAAPGSTWDISVLGNAGTVTNGVYTSGSYVDPSWISALASSKLVGAVPVTTGGTGTNTLSGILYGNGTLAVSSATDAQIVATIGSTAVANAVTATNATNATYATSPASGGSFITSSNIANQSVNYANTAGLATAATTATYATTAGSSTTTAQTNFSNLTIAGSQVLSASNFQTNASLQATPPSGGIWSPATTTRLLSNMLGDYVSIWDFYISGQTYWNTAINNAINAISSAGGSIYFPAGVYALNAPISISTAGIALIGAGRASNIYQTSSGSDIFDISSYGIVLSNLQLSYQSFQTSTSCSAIYDTNGQNIFENLYIFNSYYGINCGSTFNGNRGYWNNITVETYRKSAFYMHDGAANVLCSNFYLLNPTGSGVDQTQYAQYGAIRFYNWSQGHLFDNGQIFGGSWSFVSDSATYSSSYTASVPGFSKFSSIFFDQSLYGMYINNALEFDFDDCWVSSSYQNGCTIAQVDGIRFTGGQSSNNFWDGVHLESTAKNVSFANFRANGNSKASANVYSGLSFNGSQYLSIVGCNFNDTVTDLGTQAHGILLNTGTNYITISDNVFTSVAKSINNVSGGNNIFINENINANDSFAYHDVSGSRSLTGPTGTVYNYQNTTSRPIFVEVFGTSGSTNNMNMWISSTSGALGSGYAVSGQSGTAMSVSSYVPPGWWYRVESQTPGGVTILSWGEMY